MADEEQLRRAMLQQMNRRILDAAAREIGGGGGGRRAFSPPPPRLDDPPLDASSSTAWWRDSAGAPTYRATDRRAWAKPGMARLVLERLGEVVASGRRSLYGTFIDSPAALFAAMGGGASAVGMAQFRRALRRLDVAASDEAISATIEMLDPGRCYFRAFDGREFVRILTPFCVLRPAPEPPALLQSMHAGADRQQNSAINSTRRSPSRAHKQKPVWTWFADGQSSMSSSFIDRCAPLNQSLCLGSHLTVIRQRELFAGAGPKCCTSRCIPVRERCTHARARAHTHRHHHHHHQHQPQQDTHTHTHTHTHTV